MENLHLAGRKFDVSVNIVSNDLHGHSVLPDLVAARKAYKILGLLEAVIKECVYRKCGARRKVPGFSYPWCCPSVTGKREKIGRGCR
jgi:hypothetical protein